MEKSLSLEHRMKIAEEFELSGKNLHAIQIYNSIIESEPGCSEAVTKTASLYIKTGNPGAASGILNDFLEENPDNIEVRFYFAELLIAIREYERAAEILSFINPAQEPVAVFLQGYSFFMLCEYEIAKKYFTDFISLDPQGELLYEAYFYIAKAEINLHNYDSSLSALKKAGPALGNFWEYNYIFSMLYFNIGMYAHAAKYAERSINLNNGEAVHYNLAGNIYLKLGDYVKAETNFRKYIKMTENILPDTFTLIAEACLNNNKTEEALEFYEKALKADPLSKPALEGKKNAVRLISGEAKGI